MPQAKLIDGRKLAEKTINKVKYKIAKLKKKPGLAVILVGKNPESKLYVSLKEKACKEAGIEFHSYLLEEDCQESEILKVINFLNTDPEITGILVQLPLPVKFDTHKIIEAIDSKKDVDGFHSKTKIISPNVSGIIELIKSTKTGLENKNIVVLCNSKIFAQPFIEILNKSKVKYLDPKSDPKDLNFALNNADIIIIGLGKAHFLQPEMIKEDVILIDFGINKINNRTLGDVDPKCDQIAAWRTPVPGGVGPMTIAKLIENLAEMEVKS